MMNVLDLQALAKKYQVPIDQLKEIIGDLTNLSLNQTQQLQLDDAEDPIQKSIDLANQITVLPEENFIDQSFRSTIDAYEDHTPLPNFQFPNDTQHESIFQQEHNHQSDAPPTINSSVYLSKRYKDIGILGEGSMGEVRLVFDTYIGRSLAMKILKNQNLKTDQHKLKRFIDEAKFQARLQHPGIVPIYDINQLEDGRIFFTMRAIQGKTFHQMIKDVQKNAFKHGLLSQTKDGWSFRKLIVLLTQYCEIISFAHQNGLIHRDLKPQNLMIGPYQEPLILDWGIAKLINDQSQPQSQSQSQSVDDIQEDEEHQQRIALLYQKLDTVTATYKNQSKQTVSGTISGTPAYMSPEQAQGQSKSLGPRTDVYALGTILYHILTGRPPYEGKNLKLLIGIIAHGKYPKLKYQANAIYPPTFKEMRSGAKNSKSHHHAKSSKSSQTSTPSQHSSPSQTSTPSQHSSSQYPSSHDPAQNSQEITIDIEMIEFDIEKADTPFEIETPAPIELIQICEKAMAYAYEDRYADAGEMAKDLSDWLDGIRQKNEAIRLLDQARSLDQQRIRLKEEIQEQVKLSKKISGQIPPWQNESHKYALWDLEDHIQDLNRSLRKIRFEIEAKTKTAFNLSPNLLDAHEWACDYYQQLHQEAETQQDLERSLRLLSEHVQNLPQNHPKKSKYLDYLKGDGQFSISFSIPNTNSIDSYAVTLHQQQTIHRKLQKTNPILVSLNHHANTISIHQTLAMGQYLCTIQSLDPSLNSPLEIVYPFEMKRQARLNANLIELPHQTLHIDLPIPSTLTPNEIFILAGTYISGDPDAPRSHPKMPVHLDHFIIQKYPVTHAEYLAFLNDLVSQNKLTLALSHAPQEPSATNIQGRILYAQNQDGFFSLPTAHELHWQLNAPVVMINWFDACAYAQWLSQKEQKAWRLPTEWEWEKSARGTDGRAYPWGDFFDPSWCCNRLSHQGSPQVVGIDQFPTDQSPYGVMGMGGNIAEWCLDPHEDDVSNHHSVYLSKADIEKMLAIPPHSVVARTAKGGAWDDGPMFCRSAVRHRGVSSYRRASLGFRLCRSIE